MTKTDYLVLNPKLTALHRTESLAEAREVAENTAKAHPGHEFMIATVTHRIKAVVKTEWEE